MRLMKKGGLVAAVTAVALAGCVSAASAAVISTSSNTAPYTGDVQLRGDVTFTFPNGGTIACTGNGSTTFGVIGNGVVNTPSFTSVIPTFTSLGNFTTTTSKPNYGIYLGNGRSITSTTTGPCTVNYPNISSCTAAKVTSAGFGGALNAAATGDTGVYFNLGPVTVNATCTTSGGSSINCIYTTGAGVPGSGGTGSPLVSDLASYSGTPAKASTITLSNNRGTGTPATPQIFYRSGGTGGATCPNTGSAGTAAVAGTVSGTFRVYNSQTATGLQLSAYK